MLSFLTATASPRAHLSPRPRLLPRPRLSLALSFHLVAALLPTFLASLAPSPPSSPLPSLASAVASSLLARVTYSQLPLASSPRPRLSPLATSSSLLSSSSPLASSPLARRPRWHLRLPLRLLRHPLPGLSRCLFPTRLPHLLPLASHLALSSRLVLVLTFSLWPHPLVLASHLTLSSHLVATRPPTSLVSPTPSPPSSPLPFLTSASPFGHEVTCPPIPSPLGFHSAASSLPPLFLFVQVNRSFWDVYLCNIDL